MVTKAQETITIRPLNFQRMRVLIEGTAPYMQLQFSMKARLQMQENQEAGSTAKGKKVREAKDFDALFEEAKHVDAQGRMGIPASAFRNALIRACKAVGYEMTLARMSIFTEADTLDKLDGSPLVFIEGEPERTIMPTRNATGVVDLRVRPMWRTWRASPVIKWDADQFTQEDVINLMVRAGAQVGIGEGRPFSKSSNGIGFGTFAVRAVAVLESKAPLVQTQDDEQPDDEQA